MSFGFAVLTISDRCCQGEYHDVSGPLLKQLIDELSYGSVEKFVTIDYALVPDEKNLIKEKLIKWSNRSEIDCILTTGGTGLTPRDVTPEATEEVIEKEVPGITIALLTASFKITPMAMLSRMKCGILNNTLIINLPGSSRACGECFDIIKYVLKHAIDQLKNSKENINFQHTIMKERSTEKIEEIKSQAKEIPISKRPRHSPFKMIEIGEAFKIIVSEVGDYFTKMSEQETIKTIPTSNLYKALNFVLAKDIYATVPLPPFEASIKDGYAVIASEGSGTRKVLQPSLIAGSNPFPRIEKGFCARINTGAAIPPGADAVVQIEDTELIQATLDNEEMILIKSSPVIGQDIRPIGSDIKADYINPIIKKYTQLNSIDLGLIASTGAKMVEVFKRPIVAVLSTGDEIVAVGEERPSHCVWDSNRTILMALLSNSQFEVIDLGISSDSFANIFVNLKKGFHNADVIITTGGVSMGERDLMKQILEEDFKAQIHFGRVNMKPGKPTTFATIEYNSKKKFIFALPGNPVSAFVTYKIFVEPSLQLLSGKYFDIDPKKLSQFLFHKWIKCRVNLEKPYKMDSRPEFVRANIFLNNEDGDFIPIAKLTESNQISSRLLNVKNANVLLYINSHQTEDKYLKNDDVVDALLL